jgi:carbon-monoxide dehydrogenase small subunit
MPIRLRINGEDRVSNSDPLSPLVDVLRDEFFLTGAKPVCREGFCGACTVLLAGEPIASCLMPAGLVADREVRTVEGLAPDGDLSPLQRALEEHDVVQCGMCFPGLVVTLTRYFERAEHPNRTDMKAALAGNVCRCTGYERILDAALSLVRTAETP